MSGKGIIFPREVIIAYIEKYIGETDYLEHDDWINIDSIYSNDSRKRMGFNISRNWVNDYKSGQSWPLERFVAEHLDISQASAKKILLTIFFNLKRGGIQVTPISRDKLEHSEKKELVELDALPYYLVPPSRLFTENFELKRKALNFLKSKNIEEKHIKKFDLRVVDSKRCWKCESTGDIDCPVCKGSGQNPYYGRIIIPTTENKELVYFQARSFLGSELRYRNVAREKKNVVCFIDLVKENSERVCVLEGALDAMTLVEEDAVSVMGPSMSYSQILKILAKKPKCIVLVPDFDQEESTREKILKMLAKNIKKIQEVSDVKIAIYEWYTIPEIKTRLLDQMRNPNHYDDKNLKKDINDFNVDKIEETYLKYIEKNNSLIEKLKGAANGR